MSSALTVDDLGAALFPIVLDMLGLTPNDIPVPEDSQAVRQTWPTGGAPSQNINDDVLYMQFTLKDDPYDKIRDQFNWGPAGWGEDQFGREPYGGALSGDPALTQQWNYTRCWEFHFSAYGPNSFDNLRAIRSGLFLDYFTSKLASSQLFPVSAFPQVIRAPENINGQWWERSDLHIDVYEFVTEMLAQQTIKSVEVEAVTVILETGEGWGQGGFGQGPFGGTPEDFANDEFADLTVTGG